MEEATYRLRISGLVQGIGFRPFIFRLAASFGLAGQVVNRNDGVDIELNASPEQVRIFLDHMIREAPEASSIEDVDVSETAARVFSEFSISESRDISDRVTEISPDIAVCSSCLEDLEQQPHRISYPLINCTHCGPRFSIISALPYDRANTSMAPFEMCPECHAEYHNIHNRRFHAQPVACNNCGPSYTLTTRQGITDNLAEILEKTGELFSGGALLAIKGTGGFHLVCDAFNKEGIRKLRKLKERDGKPFALMFPHIKEAQSYVEISQAEEDLLKSWRRPIVLLKKKRAFTPGIADGLSTLGIMLPYMPFHHLLFRSVDTPALVVTSGNLADEPILISDDKVSLKLSDRVDGVVSYNREIFNRVDDSVTAVFGEFPMVLRRARGYTPSPIRSGMKLEGILGTGAELMGSFCIGKGKNALMSPYTGDLKNLETFDFYKQTYQRYSKLFRFTPELVVSDLHPDYLSTRFAREVAAETGAKHISVQHHHAHIASGMFSAGVEGEVMGFSLDGTGRGTDGGSWGAEVIRAAYAGFERLYHFEYMPLPGGDRVVQEPWRMGIAYLANCYGSDLSSLKIPLTAELGQKKIREIGMLIEKGINTPLVSSAGRLFDAVAAITGLNYHSTYQAQSPMLLESAIDSSARGSYVYEISGQQVSFQATISQIVNELQTGVSTPAIAAKFHNTLVEMILHLAAEIREDTGLDRVVLAGGTFQNRFLTTAVRARLEAAGFQVILPETIPVNDQGICVGQLAIGAHRR